MFAKENVRLNLLGLKRVWYRMIIQSATPVVPEIFMN
jgi:hypothetical protein